MRKPSKRKCAFAPTALFRRTYKEFKKTNPEIVKTMEKFSHRKEAIPPVDLPQFMKDHRLKGNFKDYRECHLAHDILLIYKHENNTVMPLLVCTHDDIHGSKAAKTLARLRAG